ncbi:histidine kinase [Sporosarcina thermotolerans]|uniref:Histidine kinase n=1 Tax=Sporosarcina thermotolerans TaxID=633404 RepID=A0AAW9A508_9BACL|nr:histidine kinase [Sporosarcina thermotolerans]MDW0116222.1 histidine kinase [Sporosarcina thermotolerans]WHT48192.1 histidine kinase [Sporosarcina thermotolerans]
MIISSETFSFLSIMSVFVTMAALLLLLMVISFEKQISDLSHEKREMELTNSLQQSTYMQLNQQIHPHFLFNTISLLIGLARLNRLDTLIKSLESLSLLLKFKYQNKDPLIPLHSEIEYTKSYLRIQGLRFSNRLTIEWSIDASTLDYLIPPYLIQTLTENAFKHGLEKKVGQLLLQLETKNENDHFSITITDNGLGFEHLSLEKAMENGHGLLNLKQRLDLLFTNSLMELVKGRSGETSIRIQIPKSH